MTVLTKISNDLTKLETLWIEAVRFVFDQSDKELFKFGNAWQASLKTVRYQTSCIYL